MADWTLEAAYQVYEKELIMKVIVEHNQGEESYLGQYTTSIECLSLNHKILDIEEKYLSWLSGIAIYIEPNFTIQLCEAEEYISESILNSNDILIATIGSKYLNERIDAYYNIMTHTLEQPHTIRASGSCQWINCYSSNNEIDVVNYIKCIGYLKDISNKWHKPIVIYADIYVANELCRYRALAYKIINSYLTDMNGVFIIKSIKENIYKYYTPSQKSYEFYLDHTIYLEDSVNDAAMKAIPFLYSSRDYCRFKNIYRAHRQSNTLYDDTFYKSISPDQEIYVPLNLGNFREPEDYEALGLEHIPLVGDYGMLHGKRSTFDALSEVLKPEVFYTYYTPILSHSFCDKNNIPPNFTYSLMTENLKYKGRGVYIGIITTDDVDYTNKALRTKEGQSRIAYIWNQIRVKEGESYFKEQIDEALASSNPGEMIKLPSGDSISTMMLGIAGGMSEDPNYRGIATEAEFVVAKLNTAPEALQRLYGGMPNENAITMPDAMIGAMKLMDFAREKGKPLVLCMPFNSNIDPHDGSLILNQMLGLMAQKDYLAIIVPAGEEADKRHHYGVEGDQPSTIIVNMRVQKEKQNIVGVIFQRFTNIFTTVLYPPVDIATEPINLKTEGITVLKGATIYSNGYKISFLNGAIRILFRIENPQVGGWRIEIASDTERLSQIDIWISQQELNGYITLSPNSPFVTVGSMGNTNNVMTVGGYNKEGMVVLKSSGRGYSWDDRVKPLFVTHANNIMAPCKQGEWVSVTGTLPAASIMLGAVATLFNKFIEEEVFPFPNTLVMNSMILSVVKQLDGVEYPNPSQGYGIFDLETLSTLLTTPFIL